MGAFGGTTEAQTNEQAGALIWEVERQGTVWFVAWVITLIPNWMKNVLPYILEEGFLRVLSKAVGRLA